MLFLAINCFFAYSARGQHLNPDKYYRQQMKFADSIINWRVKQKVDSTTFRKYLKIADKIYCSLSKKYTINDLASFFIYLLQLKTPKTFILPVRS